jgi:ATP-dependent Lon protease
MYCKRHIQYNNEFENQYYITLPEEKRIKIDNIEEEISLINIIKTPLRFRIIESNMDITLKCLAINKLEQLYMMDSSTGEYFKSYNYIENICKIPIGKYKKMNIDSSYSAENISLFLDKTKKQLDDTVYGHDDAKNQIIRLLAKWISNPDSGGLVIGINGPMGCGKTLLCKDGICKALGLPFGFISLGGIADGSYLLGHSYTYEGSKFGRIADILSKTQCMNPILYFDELDKISTSHYGDEISNILIHITDSTQNDKFHDKYFADLDFDLSKCLIIFSYNNEELINPILRDRMITIKTNGYNARDKISIAKNYMLPEMYKNFCFSKDDVIFNNDIIDYIIKITDKEEGVRNLKRSLEEIISQINLHKLLNKSIFDNKIIISFPLEITNKIVDKFLTKNKKDEWKNHSMYL